MFRMIECHSEGGKRQGIIMRGPRPQKGGKEVWGLWLWPWKGDALQMSKRPWKNKYEKARCRSR